MSLRAANENFSVAQKRSYLLGYIVGDGNLSRVGYMVRLYDQNKSFVDSILVPYMRESFNAEPKVFYDKSTNGYVVYVYSKNIWSQVQRTGVPVGDKARIVHVPVCVKQGTWNLRLSYLAGFFDAEGSLGTMEDEKRHPRGYSYFQLKTMNPSLINETVELVKSVVKITPRVYHYSYGSILRINGLARTEYCLSFVGVKHPRFFCILTDKKHGPGSPRLWRA